MPLQYRQFERLPLLKGDKSVESAETSSNEELEDCGVSTLLESKDPSIHRLLTLGAKSARISQHKSRYLAVFDVRGDIYGRRARFCANYQNPKGRFQSMKSR